VTFVRFVVILLSALNAAPLRYAFVVKMLFLTGSH
jgi:hypothetical protein